MSHVDDIAPRLLVIGAGTAGLVTALEACRAGLCVDLLDVHEQFPAGFRPNRDEPDASQAERALARRFAQEVLGLDLGQATTGGQLHQSLLAAVHASVPDGQLRFLRGTEALRLLRGKDGAVVGVRTRTFSGGRQVSEANLFADAVVVAAHAGRLLAGFGGGRCDGRRRAVTDGGAVVGGLFVFAEAARRGAVHSVVSGLRIASIAAEVHSEHVKSNGRSEVPQHRPYYDHSGVLHDTALRPDEWTALPLENRMRLTKYNHLFRFRLPRPTDQVGLFAGQYLAVRAQPGAVAGGGAGQALVRYYSPVSRNSEYGRLDLLIKLTDDEAPPSSMQSILKRLRPGDTLDFKAPMGGMAYHRNSFTAVGMVAGGTGITPMLQIMRSVAHHAEDKTPVSLVYGSQNEDDVLCKEELLYYSATRRNLHVHVTLENPPPHWSLGQGMVSPAVLREHLPPPEKGVVVLLCGPPPMIKAVRRMLTEELGYTEGMLYDFLRPPKARRNQAASEDDAALLRAASKL